VTLLLGALTIGLILSLLALGVYITFRIFHFPDITVDGSITLGASLAAVLIVHHVPPLIATLAAGVASALAGSATGILYTRFKINGLLAGILVMTALYSINLHIMGQSNISLMNQTTLFNSAVVKGSRILQQNADFNFLGWNVASSDLSALVLSFVVISIVALLLYFFMRTNLGTAMRATGDNDQMIRALGTSTNRMQVSGLALSNGLIGISGALLAQYQGFADVQMGIGMVVWGLASVIIGSALVGSERLGLTITGAVMGSVLFRLLIAIALRCGLNPIDLKLVTAVFVFGALVFPGFLGSIAKRKGVHAPA
jgi:putative tryptophan/tyrosine transport system permease protein